MGTKVGDRVGAILSVKDNTVMFLGYGVYVGDEVPHESIPGVFAGMMRENQIKNPRICLDSGKSVYGFECWWGDEARVKDKLKDQNVILVDIYQIRVEG
ncbi:MAG: hypothetical protein CSYNP_04173 [Syntrophus sp. SKADARSKE-3]|nr:hypothetical protein [Syntrophus sp. SKADARSKE-3]